MRFKITILLIVLNLVLFSLIFYIDRVQSTKARFEANSRLILKTDFVEKIDRIRITSAQTQTIWEFGKSPNSTWAVSTPINWKANPYAIQQILFQLRTLSWESRFPVSDLNTAGQSLETYGLHEPAIQVELFAGSETRTLSLGATTKIGNRLYTMSPDGDFVWVISGGIAETLRGNIESFVDRRLFGLAMDEVRVIQIQDRSASNIRVRLERKANGWRFISPIEAEADSEQVQALLTKWQGMQIESFDNDPEVTTNEMREDTVSLTLEGLNQRETLTMSPVFNEENSISHYQSKRALFSATFKVEPNVVQQLTEAQETLREKRILRSHADGWTSLSIQFGDLSTTLQQLENGDWQVLHTGADGSLQSQAASRETIEKVRTLITNLEATHFVTDAPSETDLVRYGLNTPQRILTFRKGDNSEVVLRIGDLSNGDDKSLLYANTNQSASVFLLRPHILASIPISPLHYREKTLHKLPESTEIESIQFIRQSTGEDLLKMEIAGDLMETLEAYVKNIEIGRFHTRPFADPLPLGGNKTAPWEYQLVLRFNSSSASKKVFYISDRIGGQTQYIGDPDNGLVGTLPYQLIEKIDPLLIKIPLDPGNPIDDSPVEQEVTP